MTTQAIADSVPASGGLTLTERIDTLPLRRFHWRLLVVCGVAWMFDAMDVSLIAFVLPVVGRQWHLSAVQMGWLGSMSLVGMLVGAVVAGRLADRFGRKTLLLYS